MSKSKIEWTEAVWNPIAGCSKVSAGCKNCYAEKMAVRCSAMGQAKYVGVVDAQGRWTGRINFDEKALVAPLGWRKGRVVFVNSMSDLFHPEVPFEFIDRVFAVMALCPQHTFQVLTKRPERMAEYLGEYMAGKRQLHEAAMNIRKSILGPLMVLAAMTVSAKDKTIRPLPNVWLGTSVENQEEADRRVPLLLGCPAAVRFLSCEPLLGAVDLSRVELVPDSRKEGKVKRCGIRINPLTGQFFESQVVDAALKIDWVICGGESKVGARPMHPDWARGLRDQCVAAGVPFFFKQWGEWAPGECAQDAPTKTERTATWFNDQWSFGQLSVKASEEMHMDDQPDLYWLGKKKAGRLLDGREWNEMPFRAVVPSPTSCCPAEPDRLRVAPVGDLTHVGGPDHEPGL